MKTETFLFINSDALFMREVILNNALKYHLNNALKYHLNNALKYHLNNALK